MPLNTKAGAQAMPPKRLFFFEGLAVLSGLLLRVAGARASFQFDDFLVLSEVKHAHFFDAGFLFQPIFNHLNPGLKLLSGLMIRAVGFHYGPYLWLLAVLHAVAALLLLLLLRRLRVTPGLRVLLVFAYAVSPVWCSTASLWTSGAQAMPVECLGLACLLLIVDYHLAPRWWTLTLGLTLWAGAALFHEFGLLVGPAGVALCVLMRALGWPTDHEVKRLRLTAALVGASLALYFALTMGPSHRVPGRLPDGAALLGLYEDTVVNALAPIVLGGRLAWRPAGVGVAAPPIEWSVVATVALAALIITAGLRNPRSLWWFSLPAVFIAFQTGLVAYVRLGQLGALVMRELRYLTDLMWMIAIAIGVAFSTPPTAWFAGTRASRFFAQRGSAALVAAAVVVGAASTTSIVRYEAVTAGNGGPRYFATVAASVAALRAQGLNPAIVNGYVPDAVVPRYLGPWADFDHVFRLAEMPLGVDLVGHDPCLIDGDGQVVAARFKPIFSQRAEAGGCLDPEAGYPSVPLGLAADRYVMQVELAPKSKFSVPFVETGVGADGLVSGPPAAVRPDGWVEVPQSGAFFIATHPRPVDAIGAHIGEGGCLKVVAIGTLSPR
jgi:hypothetical protein